MGNSASIRVGAPGAKQAATEVEQLHDKFTKLSTSADKWTKSGLAAGVGAGIALKGLNLLGDAVSGVTGFLGDSIHAYQEEEVSQGRLTAALNANVKGWQSQTGAIQDATEAGVKLGFVNNQVTDSMAILVAATHDVGQATRILSVAEDLARFKGLSLVEAATALTTIEAGRARGLAQLGINVKDFSTTEERLAAVEKLAGGQAAAYADTDLGKVEAASAKAQEAQEKFGEGLSHLESIVLPAAADAVTGLADSLDYLTRDDGGYMKWVKSWTNLPENIGNTDASVGHLVPQIQHYGKALDDLVVTIDKQPHAMSRAGEATGSYVSWLQDLAHAASGADRSVADLSSELEHDLFGKASEAGKEADLKGQIADLTKELNGSSPAIINIQDRLAHLRRQLATEAPGTDAYKTTAAHIAELEAKLKSITSGRQAVVLKGQIADLRQALFDLQLEEAKAKGPQAAIDFLLKIKTTSADARKQIDLLIAHFRTLLAVAIPGGTYGGSGTIVGGKALAGGGVIRPGDHGTVGEDGIEDFESVGGVVKITPRHKGTPAPSGGGWSGGSGGSTPAASTVININVSGVSVLTPGSAEALARQITPAIATELRRRRLIGASA